MRLLDTFQFPKELAQEFPGAWAALSRACPSGARLTPRALANVLLLRVVVIYILSVYINLSAAALAALLQSACLLRSLGAFPDPATHWAAGGDGGALGITTTARFRPGPDARGAGGSAGPGVEGRRARLG
ncbi:hypothetical protein H8959_002078 [Pygathrix nigripes]